MSMNTLPVLFIRGGKSPYVSEDDLDLMADHFVHIDDHTIDEVGHWLHAQAPDEFYEVTADFLGQVPRQS